MKYVWIIIACLNFLAKSEIEAYIDLCYTIYVYVQLCNARILMKFCFDIVTVSILES